MGREISAKVGSVAVLMLSRGLLCVTLIDTHSIDNYLRKSFGDLLFRMMDLCPFISEGYIVINFHEYVGKKLLISSVDKWRGSDVQQIFKRNEGTIVWRIRDNNQEKDNFVFLVVYHHGNVITNIDLEIIYMSAIGSAETLCSNLTKNELKEVVDILVSCVEI